MQFNVCTVWNDKSNIQSISILTDAFANAKNKKTFMKKKKTFFRCNSVQVRVMWSSHALLSLLLTALTIEKNPHFLTEEHFILPLFAVANMIHEDETSSAADHASHSHW